MRPALSLLLMLAVPPAWSADAPWRLDVSGLTLAGRIAYVLGDGTRAFVDEDARRALLSLSLSGGGGDPVVGWQDLVITDATTDSGVTLQPTLPASQGWIPEHGPHAQALRSLVSLGLPLAAAPFAGLAHLSGSLTVITGQGAPLRWRLPVDTLILAHHVSIAEQGELAVSLADADPPNHGLALRLSRPARLAVVGIRVVSASGEDLGVHAPRQEHRGPGAPATEDGSQVLTWAAALPAGSSLEFRYHPHVARACVRFDLTDVHFGLTLPSAQPGHAGEPRGANDL